VGGSTTPVFEVIKDMGNSLQSTSYKLRDSKIKSPCPQRRSLRVTSKITRVWPLTSTKLVEYSFSKKTVKAWYIRETMVEYV
jgi:hypothetical protein